MVRYQLMCFLPNYQILKTFNIEYRDLGLEEEGFSYLGEKEEAMQVNMSENYYNQQAIYITACEQKY